MTDYYNILGVDKSATQEDIKKAYKKKAFETHPDRGGDEESFKKVNEAYSVLSNQNKKQQYDNFGTSEGFNPNDFSGFGGFKVDMKDFAGMGGMEEILREVFNKGFRQKGKDVKIDISITLEEALKGTNKEISIPYRKKATEKISIPIPAGIFSGQSLKFSGYGEPFDKESAGDPGDLIIKIHVENHKDFTRTTTGVITNLELLASEALLGKRQKMTNIEGNSIEIEIPESSKNGDVLRVNIPNSLEFFIKINVKTKSKLSSKAKKLLEELKKEGV